MLIVAVDTGSAVKPSWRSDHTSWLTAPVRTAIRGARSIGSPAGGAVFSRRNVSPLSRPASSSARRASGLNVAIPGVSDAGTPAASTAFKVRTAVGESRSSA